MERKIELINKPYSKICKDFIIEIYLVNKKLACNDKITSEGAQIFI